MTCECSALTTLTDSVQRASESGRQRENLDVTESFAHAVVAGYSRKRREVGTADVNALSTARDGARHRSGSSRCRPSPTPSPKAYLIPSEAESPRWKQRGLFLPPTYY
jgi:hypothetical protein